MVRLGMARFVARNSTGEICGHSQHEVLGRQTSNPTKNRNATAQAASHHPLSSGALVDPFHSLHALVNTPYRS